MNRIEINHTGKDAEFVGMLLDNYFATRDNHASAGFIEDYKTTQDIQDELEPMYHVERGEIVGYLVEHGYGMKTHPDGTVRWAIWRMP